MTDDKNQLSTRIAELRGLLKLSHRQFADELKVAPSTAFCMERGEYKPGYPILRRIIEVYKVNPYFLLFGEKPILRDSKDNVRNGNGSPGPLIDTMNDLLWYMRRSNMFNSSLMAFGQKVLKEKGDIIDMEIEGNVKRREEK